MKWRIVGLLFGILFCVCVLIPSFVAKEQRPAWYPFSKVINLGLDLQGGLHIVYSIDLDRAVEDRAHEIKRDLDQRFIDDKIAAVVTTPKAPIGTVFVKVTDAAKRAQVESAIHSDYDKETEPTECAPEHAGEICFKVAESFAEGIKKSALANAVTTIRERIDEKGIAEPTVVEKGDEILVELPGLKAETVQETRDIIARTAKLEFKVVDDGSAYMQKVFQKVGKNETKDKEHAGEATDLKALQYGIRGEVDVWKAEENNSTHQDWFLLAYDREEEVNAETAKAANCKDRDDKTKWNANGTLTCKLPGSFIIDRYIKELGPDFKMPEDHEILYELTEAQPNAKDKRSFWRSYYLDRAVSLTGSAISKAQPSYDQNTNRPNVSLEFNRFGSRVFGDLTAKIVGKKLATVLDDKVRSAPVIQVAIRGGRASITMGGQDANQQEKEVNDLVNVLRTGSLPAPLKEESASKIGPTLGLDAIAKTRLSFGLGLLLVIGLMVGIYRWSGWVAVFAVSFHVLVTLAVMAMFGATLTLPGIAALVLSVGMCVDGNILINERIRDELLLGKSVRGSIDLGFSRAFSAILDGQFTIAASAWVLLQYGSGPIKGFAVMMLVGVFTTVATNTWVTRILFDWRSGRNKNATTLSI
ncbi:MAG TPA: protein translocase subunit SecD [Kofleriaceae bacterium]